jgi:hypothetical protein
MFCASCGQRKGRRACPALASTICPVCCGTKRLVEIRCPQDCPYLASAREHPAAVVRKQQERDVARLLPTIQHLTERQYQLFFLFQTAISRYRPDGLARLADADVADAVAALASTHETAVRGVIYEHAASSLPAQGLVSVLKALLAQIREQGARVFDGEVAIVLRAIEQGARTLRTPGESDIVYLELMARLLKGAAAPEPTSLEPETGSSLILP